MYAPSTRLRSAWGTFFRSTDDGAGGWWATFVRGMKFHCRLALRKSSIEKCMASMDQLGRDLGAHYPIEICLRPLRPYLCKGLSVASRVQCVVAHFRWLHDTLPSETCRALCQHEGLIIPIDSAECADVELVLRQSASQSREGELSFDLFFRKMRLMSATFSVVETRAANVQSQAPSTMLLGGFQGVRGTEQDMRELSARLEKLRPSAILICALQGLCAGWRLPAPVAVSHQSHVSATFARKRRIQLDYDAVWSEAGSARVAPPYWQLPASPWIRPAEQVPSKHRAQHRRRSALKTAVFDTCRVAAASMASGASVSSGERDNTFQSWPA